MKKENKKNWIFVKKGVFCIKSINMVLFFVGIGCFSAALGFLVGASNTPVVGAIITGVLAVMASLISLFKKNKKIEIKTVGKTLIVFSSFLIIGVLLGSGHRRDIFKAKETGFIWDECNEPSTPQEIFDWLIIERKLEALNYSEAQIRAIYKLVQEKRPDSTYRLPSLVFPNDSFIFPEKPPKVIKENNLPDTTEVL